MHSGGAKVTKGSYWDPTDGRRVDMGKEGILPGDERRSYLRVSPVGLLVVAPLFGVMFVLFLPFFGLGVLLILCVVAAFSALATVNSTAVQVCCGRTANPLPGNAKAHRTKFFCLTFEWPPEGEGKVCRTDRVASEEV